MHKSHITSSEAKSRGWSRIPSPAIQRETKKQEVGSAYMSTNYLNVSASDCCDSSSDVTLAYSTGTNAYYPYQTWVSDWTYWSDDDIKKLINTREVTQMNQRTLFKVYVVDPRKNGKVLLDGFLVIAVNENQAMLKAGVADIADAASLDLEQVDVYVQTIGTFIRPRKETQRVKMVKGEED